MSQEYAVKLMVLHEQAKADEYYRCFLEEYRQADRQLLRLLQEMAPMYRDAVMDYVAAVNAVNARLLELSLSSQGKS